MSIWKLFQKKPEPLVIQDRLGIFILRDPRKPRDDEGEADEGASVTLEDPDIKEAVRIVRAENVATASLLQREMNIGYAKAARIIDQLEELGVVGPFNGSQPREVLPYDEPDDLDGEE